MPDAEGRLSGNRFRDELLRRGLLTATGVAGVYGRGREFEDTVDRIDRLVDTYGARDCPDVMRFPPILNRAHFERSGYLSSFPHLAGTVHSFAGEERAHRALLEAVEVGGEWSAGFAHAGVVLTPAACYPVYPLLTGSLPERGRIVDVMCYCFRHEPSDDPARMQMFRMHEHVRAAEASVVVEWRTVWMERARALTSALGLDANAQPASDPFFGRAGKLLATGQREQGLKMEIVVPVTHADQPGAIISLNYHQEHFAHAFDIRTAGGEYAHTGCVGFGLERIALALYLRHGFDRLRWPPSPREALHL